MNKNIDGTQVSKASTVTLHDFRAAMADILTPGEDVLVHASLGGLGRFEGTVEDIVTAIQDALGPEATLVMMTATRSFASTKCFSIDQPSETGLLTECFRKMKDVRRSCVPMVSFCARGPRSIEYTQSYDSHLDKTATLTRLLENNGRIMLLGLDYKYCTLYHLAEERCEVPYNFLKTFSGSLFENGCFVRPISQSYYVRRDTNLKKDCSVAARLLEDHGNVKIARIGEGLVRVFLAREFDECCMISLRNNPEAFLTSPG